MNTRIARVQLGKRDENDSFDVILDDGRTARCWEAIAQPYTNCVFSAGQVEGLGVDTVYFSVKRNEQVDPYMLFLRPDEMQAMAWVCSGALWSHAISEMEK